MIKYASNAFLAVKIGFINEIANLCDRVGADVHVVAKGMGLDKRIGSKFLHPGPGYGGSCFPKDTRALAALGVAARRPAADRRGRDRNQYRAAICSWSRRSTRRSAACRGRRIAVLGLAFKPNTDDVRESPALYVCRELAPPRRSSSCVRSGCGSRPPRQRWPISGTDDHALERCLRCRRGADAVVIMTEWNEFRGLRFAPCQDAHVDANRRGRAERARSDPARAPGFSYAGKGHGTASHWVLA